MATPRLDRMMREANERNTPRAERPHLLFAHARAVEEALEEAVIIIRRYRTETPLNHQPCGIGPKVEDWLSANTNLDGAETAVGKDR